MHASAKKKKKKKFQYDTGNQGSRTCPVTHELQQAEPTSDWISQLQSHTFYHTWLLEGILEFTAKKTRKSFGLTPVEHLRNEIYGAMSFMGIHVFQSRITKPIPRRVK